MSTQTEAGPLLSTQTSWAATRPLVHSAIAFIVIDTLIVLAKSYSRLFLARLRFWWDDFWIIMAFVLLMPICAIGIAMAAVETSWSNEDRVILDLDENEILLKYIFTLLQFLLASYAATRYSILALYLRIFSDRPLRIAIWVVVAFVTLQWFGFGITAVFQCAPVNYFWNRRIEGTCVDVDSFYRSVTPFNILVDIALVLMPLPVVWKLKASNMRKWALTFLFGIGIAALIVSAIRLRVYTTHTAKYIAPSLTNAMVSWLVIEPSIYLIAACLPAMHHIVAAAVPRRVGSWMAHRMVRLTHLHTSVLSRTKTGNMSLASEAGAIGHDDGDFAMELANGSSPPKASAHAGRGQKEDVDWDMLNQGIVVTHEVEITYSQEEMIEKIIGF